VLLDLPPGIDLEGIGLRPLSDCLRALLLARAAGPGGATAAARDASAPHFAPGVEVGLQRSHQFVEVGPRKIELDRLAVHGNRNGAHVLRAVVDVVELRNLGSGTNAFDLGASSSLKQMTTPVSVGWPGHCDW
jgi:hypothetical protein